MCVTEFGSDTPYTISPPFHPKHTHTHTRQHSPVYKKLCDGIIRLATRFSNKSDTDMHNLQQECVIVKRRIKTILSRVCLVI